MLCFTERHVLLEDLFYLRVGTIGGHVLLFEMSYCGMVVMSFMRMCYGSMCSRWACLASLCRSNHLSYCEFEFRHLVVFSSFYSKFCLLRDILSKNLMFEYSSWVCWFIHVIFLVDFKNFFLILSVGLLAH